jgi:Tfp pilus assembly protein PilW
VSRRAWSRGFSLVELLVGTVLGLLVVATLTTTVGTGARLLAGAGARGEGEDTAQLAVEALTFDLRRAGFDPAATGVAPLTAAGPDRLALAADLDGDGAVDPTSEETVGWSCAAGKLSRLVGRQSMPMADGVGRCAFRYLDAAGRSIAAPPGGVAAADLGRVRALALDVAVIPPGLHAAAVRTALLALRTRP